MKLFTVDAFTDRPFAGNPAAVAIVDGPLDDAQRQALAAEMNLSETAFVELGEERHGLRWFTPAAEVDLCGHATLASAHVLFTEEYWPKDKPAYFDTRSGELVVRWEDGALVMDFPVRPTETVTVVPEYKEMIPGSLILSASRDKYNLILELPDEASVRAAKPNMEQIARYSNQAMIITSVGEQHDFVSRFFGPNVGVPEDPVTGSAHCQLAPFWEAKLHKTTFTAFQASARGGELQVSLERDRCLLKGQAVTVLRGEVNVG